MPVMPETEEQHVRRVSAVLADAIVRALIEEVDDPAIRRLALEFACDRFGGKASF